MKTILRWYVFWYVLAVVGGFLAGQGAAYVRAQTTPPVPLYYLEFVQPTTGRVILYGPNPSLAACLADMQAIRGAVAGLGSTAWAWQPAVICYHVP